MKKTLFITRLAIVGVVLFFSVTASYAQTTEGKDFWVTFLQADQDKDNNNELSLSLSVSSREACTVTIENPYTGYKENVSINANELKSIELYTGSVIGSTQRQNDNGKTCYAVNSEQVDTCALHVTSTANISLFATSYKKATFDATNVLPTASLLDEYYVQTYSPSDHGMTNTSQGSHFAIVATEDGTTEVEYITTVATKKMNDDYQKYLAAKQNYEQIQNDPFASEAQIKAAEQTWNEWKNFKIELKPETVSLKKGQVWYVWTGKADWNEGDLSGSHIKAKNGKKIAVFQGCPHTNIPYDVKERDHIFSQAMPVQYWGNTFAVTASKNRGRDIFRIMALFDQTEVYVDGNMVHKFDFSKDTKHYWEFEIGTGSVSNTGDKTRDVHHYSGTSHMVTTSCPAALHEFIASHGYDGVSNGDPAMLWVNPIEQQIDQITFATYSSKNGTTSHYVNIVTEKPDAITLDGTAIGSQFALVSSSNQYYFAQVDLGNNAGNHTLKSTEGGFIATVYGFTKNESYAYSAGGSTKILTQAITINGEVFTPESHNMLCGEDTIHFACHLNYEYEDITWNFGDGTAPVSGKDSLDHYYSKSGAYNAYVLIQRYSSNVCVGQSLIDSIPILVNIGRFEFKVDSVEVLPCKIEGQNMSFKVFFTNSSQVSLTGDSVHISFNTAAQQAGFKQEDLHVTPDYFLIDIPDEAEAGVTYGIDIVINSDCGGADTTLNFGVSYAADDILVQRFDNVLGLIQKPFEGKELSDFHWYKDSLLMPDEQNAVLNLKNEADTVSEYYVCFTIDKGTNLELTTCSCPKRFHSGSRDMQFGTDSASVSISTMSAPASSIIFVNAEDQAQAEWIKIDGTILTTNSLPQGGGLVYVPADKGIYILRVTTGKKPRNFKFLVY